MERCAICNELPSVFTLDTYLYATCSLVGAWVYIFLIQFSLSAPLAMPIAVTGITLPRILAVRFSLILPEPRSRLETP